MASFCHFFSIFHDRTLHHHFLRIPFICHAALTALQLFFHRCGICPLLFVVVVPNSTTIRTKVYGNSSNFNKCKLKERCVSKFYCFSNRFLSTSTNFVFGIFLLSNCCWQTLSRKTMLMGRLKKEKCRLVAMSAALIRLWLWQLCGDKCL